MRRIAPVSCLVLVALLFSCTAVYAWHDETHLAIAKAAGYDKWYNAAGADIAKLKAHQVEEYNHWFNNNDRAPVTAATVLGQAERYNDPRDSEGHLLGAIIAALREYRAALALQKYAEYNLAYCAHYLGDLSQPLHNTPYNEFNKAHHPANDGIVEKEALTEAGLKRIKSHMYRIVLRQDSFERDLAREIARIANQSRLLGYRLERENRDMTKEEAYVQLGHSASLLKAVLVSLRQSSALPRETQGVH